MEDVWYTCCDKHNIVTCYDTSFQHQYVHLKGQTTQWPKEKGQRDKQRSKKHNT
jgi:hypothetical protein